MFTTFLRLYVCGDFSIRSMAVYSAVLRGIRPNFELIRDVMVVIVTCKNEKDPMNNGGARVFTTVYIEFSDPQGQLTPNIVVESNLAKNSSSSKLCISSLLARMKNIQSEMKVLGCLQYFSLWIFTGDQERITPLSLFQFG